MTPPQVITNNAAVAVWALLIALTLFLGVVTVDFVVGAPPPAWGEWMVMGVLWALLALGLRRGLAVPRRRLTLAAGGTVRLESRTLFSRRDEVLAPGTLLGVDLRRNHFGPVGGWQALLYLADGRRILVSERTDAARQAALLEEIRRRLDPAGPLAESPPPA